MKPLTQKEVKQIWQHVWRRRFSWQRVGAAGVSKEEAEHAEAAAKKQAEEVAAAAAADQAAEEGEGAEGEDVGLFTTAEMRQHCMRQIARYQRVLQVIDSHPHLFPTTGGDQTTLAHVEGAAAAALA